MGFTQPASSSSGEDEDMTRLRRGEGAGSSSEDEDRDDFRRRRDSKFREETIIASNNDSAAQYQKKCGLLQVKWTEDGRRKAFKSNTRDCHAVVEFIKDTMFSDKSEHAVWFSDVMLAMPRFKVMWKAEATDENKQQLFTEMMAKLGVRATELLGRIEEDRLGRIKLVATREADCVNEFANALCTAAQPGLTGRMADVVTKFCASGVTGELLAEEMFAPGSEGARQRDLFIAHVQARHGVDGGPVARDVVRVSEDGTGDRGGEAERAERRE